MRISLNVRSDLSGVKYGHRTVITPQIPPFSNDIGANKMLPEIKEIKELKYILKRIGG